MFSKLRAKFIAIVMVSVAVVLAIVFTAICVNEHQRSLSTVDEALMASIDRASSDARMHDEFEANANAGEASQAAESSDQNGQSLPAGQFGQQPQPPTEATQDQAATGNEGQGESQAQALGSDGAPQGFDGPRIGGLGRAGADRGPVAVYTIDSTSGFTLASRFTTAAIDSEVLESAQERVADLEDGTETLEDLSLRYMKRTLGDTTYVAFADASSTHSWESLAISLLVAAFVTLAAFFVIAWFLSRWALRPVKEAWEAQRQFVADASHELKTPLTVILANSSILLKHPESSIASQSQWIESSQVEAENMQGLVNEMLELAQVESRAAVHHEPLDFSDLVDGEVLQFESVAFERCCMLEGSIAEGITVNGDAKRLTKAVSTLIENALKYVDESGEVSVDLKSAGKTCSLAIRNTGSTISPEDLPHIFDRFYRTDKARTSGEGGYGLGLAIAREIAREHDGDITCASSPDAGTTFTVTLPVLQ